MAVTVLLLDGSTARPASLTDFVVAGLVGVAAYAGSLWALDRQGLREAATLLRRPE